MHSIRRYIDLFEAKVWKLETLAPNSVSNLISVTVLENPTWASVQALLGRSHFDAIKGFIAITQTQPVALFWAEDITHDDIQDAFLNNQGIEIELLADLLLLGSAKSVPQLSETMPFPVLLYRNANAQVEQNAAIKRWPCKVINYDTLPDNIQDIWL